MHRSDQDGCTPRSKRSPGRRRHARLCGKRLGDVGARIACLDKINRRRVTLFGKQRLIGMRRSYYYRAQADHARRLADITVQENVEKALRHVADELDRLADDVAVETIEPAKDLSAREASS
jgi:hypothetical protein